jgi:hypothetical protein
MTFELDGYLTVAQRIEQLKAKYPDAVLRPYNPDEPFTIKKIGDKEFIVYVAACYKTPDDPMPAVAVAIEPCIPKSNFTRDSMVMNAETSAWGRCIMAALACDTSGKVASADEVRNRQDGDQQIATVIKAFPSAKTQQVTTAAKGAGFITQKQIGLLGKLTRERNMNNDDLLAYVASLIGRDVNGKLGDLTSKEASNVIGALMNGEQPSAPAAAPADEEPF